MATKAIHKAGDISRETSDICHIYGEDEDNYIGNWVFGFGFIDVKFPKNTTRELTPEELEEWHGAPVELAGIIHCLNLTGEEYPVVTVSKKGGKTYHGRLMAPIKVGKRICVFDDKIGPFITTRVVSITGECIQTKNSVYYVYGLKSEQ